MNQVISKTIVLCGGLTAGPVMPLFAVAAELRKKSANLHFVMVDVAGSIGQQMAPRYQMKFQRIVTGKLRRYLSPLNLLLPLQLLVGFLQAMRLITKLRPVAVLGAGGFVQVPVALAAKLLRVPVFLHQQDVVPTLANQLCGALATKITTTFETSLRDFPSGSGLHHRPNNEKVVWTGNPVRSTLTKASRAEANKFFDLDDKWPTVLVTGGGSGATGLNKLVADSLPSLTQFVQIIHSTGKGKRSAAPSEHYHPYEFIDQWELAIAAADIVITRAGVTIITELAVAGKPSIIVPMPGTHQEQNAALLYERHTAIVLDQRETTPEKLVATVRSLLFDQELRDTLIRNGRLLTPPQSGQRIASLIAETIKL